MRLNLTRLVRYFFAFWLAADKDGSRFLAKAFRSSVSGGWWWWFRTPWRVRCGSASWIWRRWAGHKRSCISVGSEVKIEVREQRSLRSRHSKRRRGKKRGCLREHSSAHLCLLELFLASRRTIKSTSTLAKNAGRAGAQGLSLQSSDTSVISFSNVPLLSVRLGQPDQSDGVAQLCLGCANG